MVPYQQIISSFLDAPISNISISPLEGGFASKNIKFTCDGNSYVLKVFLNDSTRNQKEIAYMKHASDLKISPAVCHSDPQNEYIILKFVDGEPLNQSLLSQKSTLLSSIASSIAKVHSSTINEDYIWDVIPSVYHKFDQLVPGDALNRLLSKKISSISNRMKETTLPLRPCHGDLNPRNILVEEDNVHLIDWDEATLSNPLFDVAYFSVFNLLSLDQEKIFFETYKVQDIEICPDYFAELKQIVRLVISLRLFSILQSQDPEILHQNRVQPEYSEEYYLKQFASGIKNDSNLFFYDFALAMITEV